MAQERNTTDLNTTAASGNRTAHAREGSNSATTQQHNPIEQIGQNLGNVWNQIQSTAGELRQNIEDHLANRHSTGTAIGTPESRPRTMNPREGGNGQGR